MRLHIPSRGRANVLYQSTLSRIPQDMHYKTVLWVPTEEYEEYMSQMGPFPNAHVVYCDYETIGEKRRIIGEYEKSLGYDTFCMLDDDVDFLVRKSDDDFRLTKSEDHDVYVMFRTMEMMLSKGYAQCAISPREGNNRFGNGSATELVVENTRAMRITAYRTDDFLSVEHNRLDYMEDFDVLLQLLRSGRKNCVLAYWANGQKMTNAPGGCSITRTLETHNRAAERLAELHPEFVRLRLKENKTDAEGLGTRKEVTVQWKRAFKQGESE